MARPSPFATRGYPCRLPVRVSSASTYSEHSTSSHRKPHMSPFSRFALTLTFALSLACYLLVACVALSDYIDSGPLPSEQSTETIYLPEMTICANTTCDTGLQAN